jgi:hypothetical protein
MPHHRRNRHGTMSAMVTKRLGGRVTLFNFNPSIAGGRIGVLRQHACHYRGQVLRTKEQDKMIGTTGTGGGLHAPGGISSRGGSMEEMDRNYAGIGATGRTAMHPLSENKKRLHALIATKMHAPAVKKQRLLGRA